LDKIPFPQITHKFFGSSILPKDDLVCYNLTMVITYYGLSCFKIQSGDTVLTTDPFSKESGLTPPRFQTDVVLISHAHKNHSNADSLAAKSEKETFIIDGPGDYETQDIRIKALTSFHDSKEGKLKGKNTIFIIEWEGMKLSHLGDYGENGIRDEILEALGTPDILFVPVGGSSHTIDEGGAQKLISQIGPRIVIPMHYKIPGLKEKLGTVDTFVKEMGGKITPEEKLTIKKNGLPTAEESKIVVLKTT
jgi:L-ascorbate metabolism protein UlaG (beta-lactamase superfamily)